MKKRMPTKVNDYDTPWKEITEQYFAQFIYGNFIHASPPYLYGFRERRGRAVISEVRPEVVRVEVVPEA
jgi:hypothetical protein